MQYDNKHLLDFRIVIDVEWLKFGENHNNGDQNRNNGVLEIHMVMFYFFNIAQHELTHVEIKQCIERDLSHAVYEPTWVKSRMDILWSSVESEQLLVGEEQFLEEKLNWVC